MSYYQELYDHMSHYHSLHLLEGEMDDIVTIALEMERNRKAADDRVAVVVEPFYCARKESKYLDSLCEAQCIMCILKKKAEQ